MEKQIGYTSLVVKAVDKSKRMIRGIASTPTPDRVSDVVEPLGAQFKNPAPLLWFHRADQPVGTVNFGKPTEKGIPFEATFPIVEEPSQLKARIEEAWSSVVSGLIKYVSIGFRPIEYSVIQETGGYRFTKTDIYELSLVSTPACPDATFEQVKQFDAEARKAALGPKTAEPSDKTVSGATGKSKTVKLTPKETKTMKIDEQIKSFQSERAAKFAKMEEIMTKSGESGESLSEEQAEEYDTLEAEVATVDKHLKRLDVLQKAKTSATKAVGAKAVEGDNEEGAAAARSGAQIRVHKAVDKGIRFARLAKCIGLSKGNLMQAAQVAEQLFPDDQPIGDILKAAVSAGTTSNSTWANPLVPDTTGVFADFIEYLRPQTILGKFGTNGIPSLRRVPFRTRLVGQTSGGLGYWVGEGAPKPVTKFDFNDTTLLPLKVANIAVITMELMRDSSPSAEAIVRDQLAAALRERLDIDFIDPAKAAAANVSPASITNGITPINSSGTDADAVRADIRALFAQFIAANNAPTNGVWIMDAVTALALSLMVNPLGQTEFPGITMNGGTFWGMPVIVSEYVPSDTAGGIVVLVNASDIYLGDEGGIAIDMSDQASLQMDNAPTVNSATPTATSLVSLWQTNSIGFRAERTINWARRRASAVAVLDNVMWGAA